MARRHLIRLDNRQTTIKGMGFSGRLIEELRHSGIAHGADVHVRERPATTLNPKPLKAGRKCIQTRW